MNLILDLVVAKVSSKSNILIPFVGLSVERDINTVSLLFTMFSFSLSNSITFSVEFTKFLVKSLFNKLALESTKLVSSILGDILNCILPFSGLNTPAIRDIVPLSFNSKGGILCSGFCFSISLTIKDVKSSTFWLPVSITYKLSPICINPCGFVLYLPLP